MDFFEELENMALNSTNEPDCRASSEEIERWQCLFSYSYEQAIGLIEKQMNDYTRRRISNDHWDMIRTDLEAKGYNQSAYEHELERNTKRMTPVVHPKVSASHARTAYVVKLEGPLSTPEDPAQGQYPIWYFFYGTLTSSSILSQKLSLPEDETPVLLPAFVTGGKLGTWAGKYKALVDAPSDACVYGSAYKVMSKEHEETLQTYETDNYEVVQCTIFIGDKIIQGCTFRFVGVLD
ncbi:MAG: hypothetical protein M1834_001683 [Cirrosporium novae-zelandiae]|nr:MAG: hypothetical protein M1834_001683 [Cirrosporium novae-zelandiae]